MNILILGKNGQIGSYLTKLLKKEYMIFSFGKNELNFIDKNFLKKLNFKLLKCNIDLVINCVAFTNVDLCEKEKKTSKMINGIIPVRISKLCKKLNIKFFHLSTEFVFDGKKKFPYSYKENDITKPINFYGKTKLFAEKNILKNKHNQLVFRLCWLYSKMKNNFVYKIYEAAKKNNFLNVVDDQYGSPTSSRFASEIIFKIILKIKDKKKFRSGIYHLCPNGSVNRFEFAKKIIKKYIKKKGLTFDPKNIYPISSKKLKLPAKRPLNSKINNMKIKKRFNLRFNNWDYYLKI